ncbi:MAG: transcription-repair coupling factor, partial [Treponema sp.]|nr:transcription-repair coupling factor [Treponema sp.]
MNTLSFPELLGKICRSKPMSACVSAVTEGKFPLEIAGCEGAMGALLLARLYAARPGLYFAVVPQEADAADLALDLASSSVPCLQFPWWGAVPYRELAPLSAVFGERVKVLGDLVLGKGGIVIIPQRAFLTPLPPPDYVKSLLVSLKPGGKIDTTGLAAQLVSYGYTRVPRVQLHGEFALRGEVLDILMGGDEEAYRILFDFDRVESIKCFDPLLQGSRPGREKLPELLIRPLREVVWTDERIEALGDNLAAFKEFADGGKSIVEELIARRGMVGEEMLYPLAFERAGSLLDYLGAAGTLVLVDRERLENAQESLNREYQGLYARSRRESGQHRDYPLPDRLLFNFKELIEGYEIADPRLIAFKTIKSEPRAGACYIDIHCEPSRSFFGNIM